MNWRAIGRSKWGRRAVFVASNIMIAVLFYLLTIEPVRRILADGVEGLSERRETLARYEAVVSQENAVQEYAKQIADSNARGELVTGESDGIVNANLQARLKMLAEQARLTVRSIQMLPTKSIRGATLVGARLEVSGALENVHTLTRKLEGETPLLLVTAATMRGQSMPWMIQTQSDQDLEAQFDIYGGALLKDHP